jgi:hypothetical protein
MLEEKNDNLHTDAEGQENSKSQSFTEISATEELSQPVNNDEISKELDDHQKALNAIEASNAEESEDETLKDRENVPMLDYEKLSMEALVEELENLLSTTKIMSVKDHVEALKKEFLTKFHDFIEEKKEAFLEENTETSVSFSYHSPLKQKFDQLYSQFKERRNTHFKSLQNNLKSNLEIRESIVEELKELINPQENIKDTLKHFNELRERWKNAGPIPKDKYNHVWNNYHFHVENFYDYLHLDREARDLDFKHNLELKLKIIERCKELVNEEDTHKAFRELQDLHKLWKEEIGPVAKEHREEIWNEFSALTKQLHDNRESYFEQLRKVEIENLKIKEAIIENIKEIAATNVTAHSHWQQLIDKIEALREAFFNVGKVPSDVNEATWKSFKTAVRLFNSNKNAFYKEIKKDQQDNLNKKLALVAKAKELKNSEDFTATTVIMKQIQEEWKTIGHVPRKHSDQLWKDFKDACNHYFERLKSQRNEANSEEIDAFEKKKEFLDQMKSFELTGEHKTDLDAIKAHIETWKSFGKVPFSRRHIEGKFNKILDTLFDKLSLSKKDSEMMKFSSKLEQLATEDDSRKIEGEKIFIRRKIDEVQSGIFQLENNIQFFANAKKDNPLVKEVRKNIERHKEELKTWKEKLKQIRNLDQ